MKLNNLRLKLKEIYLPFLIVSLGTILLYNLIRWFFDIKLGMLPLKEDLLNFWLPFILPWIPVLIWLRRIRFLKFRGSNDNGYFGYQAAMAAAITVPLLISQNYLQQAPYDLISVQNPSEIIDQKSQKYFELASFGVDKDLSVPYVTSRISGRNNERLNFQLFLACPFSNANGIWYGVQFQESVSNSMSSLRKNKAYREFLERSEFDFKDYDFQNVKYFEKLGYSDDRDGYLNGIREEYPELDLSEQVILIPHAKKFEERLGNSAAWIFGSYAIGAFLIFLMVIFPKIEEREIKNFKENKPLKDDDLKLFLGFLNPTGPNAATAILLLLNIAVFLLMLIWGLNIVSPTPQELMEIGGNSRWEVISGEYWRLFTSMFIHAGLGHLMMNLFGLGFSAILLEEILGSIRLIFFYLFCGICASLSSILWYENTVSVGASGAIFGLYGLILAFTVFKIYPKSWRRMTWLLLGLYAGVSLLIGFLGGIDNAAHIGGLISGFLIGVFLNQFERDRLAKNIKE